MGRQGLFSRVFIAGCLAVLVSGCVMKRAAVDPVFMGQEAIVIENYDGYGGDDRLIKQSFVRAPERIVATSEATIDNLIFLGLQDKIVGIGDIAQDEGRKDENIYKNIPRLNRFGGYPSKEQILAVAPDIIIGWGSLFSESAIGSVKGWQGHGIHTYVMTNTVPVSRTGERKVRYFLKDLENISRIFRIENRTKPMINDLYARLNRLEEWSTRIPRKRRPTVMTVQHVYRNEYFARTHSDLTADIIRMAGGISLDGGWGNRQSIEFLLKENPDIILVVDSVSSPAWKKIQAMEGNPILQNVSAVKNHRFISIDQNAFYCGSIYTLEAIEKLQKEVEKYADSESV